MRSNNMSYMIMRRVQNRKKESGSREVGRKFGPIDWLYYCEVQGWNIIARWHVPTFIILDLFFVMFDERKPFDKTYTKYYISRYWHLENNMYTNW